MSKLKIWSIRHAELSDTEAIARIHVEAWRAACRFYEKHGFKGDGHVHEIIMGGFALPHLFYRGKL